MLNIHLGDTVVTALAKCIFFYLIREKHTTSVRMA